MLSLSKTTLVIFVALLNFVSAQHPTPDKVYFLQSSMDSAYGGSTGFGQVCKYLSIISAVYISDPTRLSEKYRWRVSRNLENGQMNINNLSYDNNEISASDYTSTKFGCDLKYRDIELIPNENEKKEYVIHSLSDDKCLFHYGSEVGIFVWSDCGSSSGYYWRFEEAPETNSI